MGAAFFLIGLPFVYSEVGHRPPVRRELSGRSCSHAATVGSSHL
jgi:hypothetical protein